MTKPQFHEKFLKQGLFKKHSYSKFPQLPHGILDTDGKIMAIRNYHRRAFSNAVVPLPDDDESYDTPVTVGWFYIRGWFHSPCGNFKIPAPKPDPKK